MNNYIYSFQCVLRLTIVSLLFNLLIVQTQFSESKSNDNLKTALELFEAKQTFEAFALLEKGFSNKNPENCLNIAEYIRKELGKRKESIPYYMCAAKHGNADALHKLSWLTTKPFRERGIHPIVYKLLKKFSKSGNSSINYSMADFLYRTKVYLTHIEEIIEHWEIAAKGGSSGSHHRLGQIYAGMHSVRLDLKKSDYHFEQCIPLKHGHCALNYGKNYLLGERVLQDVDKALSIFQRMADQGLSEGRFFLADYQYEGKFIPKNKSDAIETYQFALNNNRFISKQGYFNLYKCHKKGKLCKKDKTLQMKYLRNAARKIHGEAAYKLGKMYEKGKKVEKDLLEAFILYMIAIYDEYNPALNRSNKIIKKWAKDYLEVYKNVTRFKLFYVGTHGKMKLSRTYDPIMNQGISLFFGLTKKQDQVKGLELIQKSIDNGNHDAKLVYKMFKTEFMD